MHILFWEENDEKKNQLLFSFHSFTRQVEYDSLQNEHFTVEEKNMEETIHPLSLLLDQVRIFMSFGGTQIQIKHVSCNSPPKKEKVMTICLILLFFFNLLFAQENYRTEHIHMYCSKVQ